VFSVIGVNEMKTYNLFLILITLSSFNQCTSNNNSRANAQDIEDAAVECAQDDSLVNASDFRECVDAKIDGAE